MIYAVSCLLCRRKAPLSTFGLKEKKYKVAGFRARTTTRGGSWTPENGQFNPFFFNNYKMLWYALRSDSRG